jgi:hypothetical protein
VREVRRSKQVSAIRRGATKEPIELALRYRLVPDLGNYLGWCVVP